MLLIKFVIIVILLSIFLGCSQDEVELATINKIISLCKNSSKPLEIKYTTVDGADSSGIIVRPALELVAYLDDYKFIVCMLSTDEDVSYFFVFLNDGDEFDLSERYLDKNKGLEQFDKIKFAFSESYPKQKVEIDKAFKQLFDYINGKDRKKFL